MQPFSSCGEWGLLFVSVHRLLIAVALLVVEHGLWGTQASVAAARGLSSCGTQAQLLRGMWNLPGTGIKPMSPALAGKFQPPDHQGSPDLILLSEMRMEPD